MTKNEAKFMLTGTLLVVLTLAVGINAALFNGTSTERTVASASVGSRSIASINPIFKVSWEKRAFEVLEESSSQDLAQVGQKPDSIEKLSFGFLKGHYDISQANGVVAKIQFNESDNELASQLDQPLNFISKNLTLFSKDARKAVRVHSQKEGDNQIERFALKGSSNQDLGMVQVLRDKNNRLLSMTVQ